MEVLSSVIGTNTYSKLKHTASWFMHYDLFGEMHRSVRDTNACGDT